MWLTELFVRLMSENDDKERDFCVFQGFSTVFRQALRTCDSWDIAFGLIWGLSAGFITVQSFCLSISLRSKS
jgi:hypothetical protein